MIDILFTIIKWIVAFFLVGYIVGIAIILIARVYANFSKRLDAHDPRRVEARKTKQEQKHLAAAEAAYRNRIVGDLYAVVKKDIQSIELWLSEDDEAWDLHTKFGWWQHKRAKPTPSSTHCIVLLKKDAVFDPARHNHLPPPVASPEARKLRLSKYDFELTNHHTLASLFVIHDRLNGAIHKHIVTDDLLANFLKNNPSTEFRKTLLATSQIPIFDFDHRVGSILGAKIFTSSDAHTDESPISRPFENPPA